MPSLVVTELPAQEVELPAQEIARQQVADGLQDHLLGLHAQEMRRRQPLPAPGEGWDIITEISYAEVDCQENMGWNRGERGIRDCGFAPVYKGVFRDTEVAIKKLATDRLSTEALDELVREAGVMCNLKHENIVKFIGFSPPPNCCLLTQYLTSSLQDLLYKEQRKLSKHELCRILIDIAAGMRYLHAQGVVHSDLKPANILVDERLKAKIDNFGLTKLKQEIKTLRSKIGTPRYMAPELLSPDCMPHNEKVDVYSFAILISEILTQKQPFGTKDAIQVAKGCLKKDLRPDLPKSTPKALKSIIEDSWAADGPSRLTFVEILKRLKAFQLTLGEDEDAPIIEEEVVVVHDHPVQRPPTPVSIFEGSFAKTIKINPEHAITLGKHANNLQFVMKEYVQAEKTYKRALKADPRHANNLGNYARLLHYINKDLVKATSYYKAALEAEPRHANNLGNYAHLLHSELAGLSTEVSNATVRIAAARKAKFAAEELREKEDAATAQAAVVAAETEQQQLEKHLAEHLQKAREHYERAMEVDPNHCRNIGNFAEFLAYTCNEVESAEALYLQGLKVNLTDHVLMRKYGIYLRDVKKMEARAFEVMNKAKELAKKSGMPLDK